MSLKLLSSRIRREILRRQAIQSAPKAVVDIRNYDDKVENPDPCTFYIYTNRSS